MNFVFIIRQANRKHLCITFSSIHDLSGSAELFVIISEILLFSDTFVWDKVDGSRTSWRETKKLQIKFATTCNKNERGQDAKNDAEL